MPTLECVKNEKKNELSVEEAREQLERMLAIICTAPIQEIKSETEKKETEVETPEKPRPSSNDGPEGTV